MEFNCSWDTQAIIITIICIVISLLVSLFFLITLIKIFRRKQNNKVFVFGSILAITIPIIVLFIVFLFLPLKVSIKESQIILQQVKGELVIPIYDIVEISKYEPGENTIRKFASGGLFGYIGIFQNKTLGEFQMYATNSSDRIKIITDKEVYVFSCDNPELFIKSVNELRNDDHNISVLP